MTTPFAMVLLVCLLLSGCAKDTPPPIIAPSHQFGPNQTRPTKMEYLRIPPDCPTFSGEPIVRLAFTITADGHVTNIRILEETHKGCRFASEAVFQFRKWRFPPHIENGVAVPYDDEYGFRFGLAP